MEIDLLSMHADIGDGAARRDKFLAKFESHRDAHCLDSSIDAAFAGHLHDRLQGLAVGAVDDRRGAEALGYFKAIIVEIDHDDLTRRVELSGEKCSEPNRPRADDRHGTPRRNLAVEHTTLEAGWQDVAEHHQRFFVRGFWDRIKAGIGVGNADEFGLRTVDCVAENPAAGGAVAVSYTHLRA